MVWDKLPAVPTIETSSVSGSFSELKGKATYLSQNVGASAKINSDNIYSKTDGKSYAILNADFDNKKINGSAAFNLYSSDNVNDIGFEYDISSSDKNIKITGSQTLYKQ